MPNRSRFAALVLAGLAAFANSGISAAATYKKSTLVAVPARVELKAPPSRVWEVVTSLDGFTALTGFKATGGAGGLRRIGDAVPAQVWEDRGRLVVTGIVEGRELRVTWEPEKGHYLCQKRIVLSPSAAGTTLEYLDRYTDDQANPDETARQVAADTDRAIEAFRKLVEN